MTIRDDAKAWLGGRDVQLVGPLYTSKLFSAASSWTGAPAWWIQIPLPRLETEEAIEIVCESDNAERPFWHMTVRTRILRDNISGFGIIGDRSINLFLSAEPDRRFRDLRGSARVDFSPFIRKHSL